MPHTAEDLLIELEVAYPPRCKDSQESLEEHARYAGQVELIQNLRRRFTWTNEEPTDKQLLAKL